MCSSDLLRTTVRLEPLASLATTSALPLRRCRFAHPSLRGRCRFAHPSLRGAAPRRRLATAARGRAGVPRRWLNVASQAFRGARQRNREMLRLMRMRGLPVVLSILLISACGTGVAADAGGDETVRLAYDADTARTISLGTTITFEVEPIDGQVPEVRVCGVYGTNAELSPSHDPMPSSDAVLTRIEGRPSTFKSVSVGKVGLCGVPAQALAKCRPHPCHDLMGEQKPMITVTVTAR